MAKDQQSDYQDFPAPLNEVAVETERYLDHQITLETLKSFSPHWDMAGLTEFDARTRGWVTPPKNQLACGSCWAFAAVGTIESRILKDGGQRHDFSEQQQVSCNSSMSGCSGGSGMSLRFYVNNGPWAESCAPYQANDQIPCSNFTCTPLPYRASGFYTVDLTIEAMKESLLTHGPSYFRYDVYQDFSTFWNTGASGSVYQHSNGARRGGHAVLLIGFSDTKGAWLLKNSWGDTTGPNGDGTFWMAYNGHATDLSFQMFNITSLQQTN